MRHILIPSLAADIHAIVVQVALELRGHRVVRWIGDEFPSLQTSSLSISSQQKLGGWIQWQGRRLQTEQIDLVWLRRPRWPVVPAYLNSHDRQVADDELRHWYRSIWEACWASHAAWVNSIHGRRRANNKLLQLKVARECGLAIPNTLISNDPQEVRRFLQSGHVIVKPFQTQNWREEDKSVSTLTALIREDQLPDDDFIQACPAIYQTCIPKAFEVRAFFCGKAALAISIDSQRESATAIDWRAGSPSSLGARRIDVPPTVQDACCSLMTRLGIVTGSFDFAVTPSGQWVFFEVNEQGQFLWMEQCVPELHATDMFVKFLEAESHWDFEYARAASPLRLKDLLDAPRTKDLLAIDATRTRNLRATAAL